MAVREEPYAEFSRRVHGKAAGRRIPVNVDYDVTYRCNLNCRHCYCNLPANDREAKEKELKLDEIERVLAEACDLGALWILLTGGEPLVRPEFREIYLTALRLGLIPSVFTNGTLVTEEWAEFFAEYRPFKIEITLYGSSADVYERVTRTPGSFERCMRGVRLLKERGLPLSVKTMVLRSNRDDLDGVRELARSLGLEFRLDAVVHGRYTDLPRPGGPDPRSERLTAEEVLAIDRDDPGRAESWRDCCDRLIALGGGRRDRLLTCGAGRYALSIGADGQLRPCGMLRFLGWDARGTVLRWIWEEDMPRRLGAPREAPTECRSCRLASLCTQCVGWQWLELEDLGERIPYLCEIARGRATFFASAQAEGGTGEVRKEQEAFCET